MAKNIKKLEEMNSFAEGFLIALNKDESQITVVGLYGNLGAGKTTLTQLFANLLRIKETVLSPTFVIMKIYELENQKYKWKHLVHIDAYRLEKSSELLHLGFNKIISNSENLVLIEWPEKIADIMPEHTKIFLKVLDENTREIEVIEKND